MSEMIREFKKEDLLYIDMDGKAQWGFPDGYPYKSEEAILDGTFEFADDSGLYQHQITDENFSYADGKSYTIIWDGEAYRCVATTFTPDPSYSALILGNLGLAGVGDDTGEPFLFMNYVNGHKFIFTKDTVATHTVIVYGENIYPIFPDFLPQAAQTTPGIVKQMPYLPNATGDAPTAENFNQLVRGLKSAGLMK